jgi:hypothetical protein
MGNKKILNKAEEIAKMQNSIAKDLKEFSNGECTGIQIGRKKFKFNEDNTWKQPL